MIVRLSEESRRFVADQVARGCYPSADAVLEDALARMRRQAQVDSTPERVAQRTPSPSGEEGTVPTTTAHKPIWETFEEITAVIPQREWEQMPPDSSEQLDHYLYGTPKHPTP